MYRFRSLRVRPQQRLGTIDAGCNRSSPDTLSQAYAEAVQRRPNDPWAHERLAFVQYASGEFAEAADHFDVSLNALSHSDSQLAERYCTLAQAQQSAGMADEALENYQICHDKLEDPAMKATVESLMEALLEVEDSTFE